MLTFPKNAEHIATPPPADALRPFLAQLIKSGVRWFRLAKGPQHAVEITVYFMRKNSDAKLPVISEPQASRMRP